MRVLLAYAAGSLVLVEAGNNILPPLGIPALVNTVLVWLVLLGLPVAAVLSWRFDVVSDQGTPPKAAEDTPLPSSRVAILPFDDMSQHGTDEYFANGVTEDLIAKLSQISSLSVVSRTSVMGFRGSSLPLPRIGRTLGAGSVVEGSVRRSGTRVRVVAQLVDANSDAHVWAETYDRDLEDLFAVQSDIAQSVAHGLLQALTDSELASLTPAPAADPGSYDLYLQARALLDTRSVAGLRDGTALFHAAIARDPGLAAAHAGLASALAITGLYGLEKPEQVMPPALEAADRALELDPRSSEAINARALVQCVWKWAWEAGAETFRRAIGTSPSDASAHHWHAVNCLAPQGNLVAAEAELRVAKSLDPLSKVVRASEGFLKYLNRDVEAANQALVPLIEGAHCPPLAHLFMGFVHELAGRHDLARREYRAVSESGGRLIEATASLGMNLALAGETAAARDELQTLEHLSRERYVSPARRAQIHAALGEWERASALWDEAVRLRASDLIWIGVLPAFDFARGRPEFEGIRSAVLARG